MKQILVYLSILLPFCAFAQFQESFSGPNVNSNHPWEGFTESFSITSEEQLQFISPKYRSGEALISVPIVLTDHMTWDIDVKLDFKPTAQNNLRIYVYSDEDFKLYIQVGTNTGQVSLYLDNGAPSPKRLIKGRDRLLPDNDFQFTSIRLKLEDGYRWTLYTSRSNEELYTEEGSEDCYLGDIAGENSFSLGFKYVQARISTYYINNIRIEGIGDHEDNPGTSSMIELVNVKQLSNTEILFFFDGPVDIYSAVCSIEDLGNSIEMKYDESFSIVYARFSESLEEDNIYYLTWSGLTDMEGKMIEEFTLEIYFEDDKEEPPALNPYKQGQVIINEVMADPKTLTIFPETEYVELHNTSEEPVQLDKWTFIYGNKETVLDNIVLPPNGYIVLYKSGRDITIDNGGLAMPLSTFPAALADSGKELQLKDHTDNLIDEIAYPKAKRGVSWEREEKGWYLSTDSRGGTPGSANSKPEEEPQKPEEPGNPGEIEEPADSDVQPGELIFNELLPNPYTGGSEYIELYNRSNRSLSMKGLTISVRKSDGSFSTVYSLSKITEIVEKDNYILLTKEIEGVSAFYTIYNPEALYEIKLPVLANTSSTLVLYREHDETVIDEISYSSKWHASSIKDQKGVSLERINPDSPSQDPNNWTSATDLCGYGTPGYKNSQFKKEENGSSVDIEAPVLREDGVYSIFYYLGGYGYSCRAYIYNINGFRVAEIANNELIGTSGQLLWTGKASDGSRLSTGIYIFYAEVYNTKGEKIQFKKAFLVR